MSFFFLSPRNPADPGCVDLCRPVIFSFCVPCERCGNAWQESLELFEKMRQGRLEEGEATLRLKMDMASPNPNMWDQVRTTPNLGWCWSGGVRVLVGYERHASVQGVIVSF